MIELIHRYPVLIKILLTVVTVSFVATGGYFLGQEDKANLAAKVGDAKITMQEYQDGLYKMEEFYRNTYQGQIPEELLKKLNLPKKALESLVDREIILQEAEKQGLVVSDKDVSNSVLENSNFKDAKGNFDQARYAEVLKYNGMTPAIYEKRLRDDLLMEKFRKMVKDSVFITDAQARDYYTKTLADQKKEFKEDEYQAQKANSIRILTLTEQEKAINSFMSGIRKNYKVEMNPSIGTNQPAS
jgi:peptidyl-prolyl cis-trans isomerase D